MPLFIASEGSSPAGRDAFACFGLVLGFRVGAGFFLGLGMGVGFGFARRPRALEDASFWQYFLAASVLYALHLLVSTAVLTAGVASPLTTSPW